MGKLEIQIKIVTVGKVTARVRVMIDGQARDSNQDRDGWAS